jgi:hypothetical protein
MNWGGLKLTTAMGFRVAPTTYPNGDAYLFHSSQPGAKNAMEGLYSESHSLPGPRVTFTTFGDGPSTPRLRGIPDVFEGPVGDGVEGLKADPAVYAATEHALLVYVSEASADAGDIIAAIADHPQSVAALRRRVVIPRARFDAAIQLLDALGYIRKIGDNYDIAVPVLTARDKPLVDSTLALSRRIMATWLTANHDTLVHELAGLSSMKAGLPFALPFSEVWHYVFGFAAKGLAEDGFFADPRAEGRRERGYVVLVWGRGVG